MNFENLSTKIGSDTAVALKHYLADRPKARKFEVVDYALRTYLRESGVALEETQRERNTKKRIEDVFIG